MDFNKIGDTVTFTIPLKNNGSIPATAVTTIVVLPAGTSYNASSPSVGTYTSGTSTWLVTELIVGQEEELELTVNITDDCVLPADITWTVTSDQDDPDATNNSSSYTIGDFTCCDIFPCLAMDGSYDNSTSGFLAENVQDAIDEIVAGVEALGINNLVDGINDGSSVYLGTNSGLVDDSSANLNVGLGTSALTANTSGDYNVAIGANALITSSTASGNVAVGANSLYAVTIGELNTSLGNQSGSALTEGENNVFIGALAGDATTTGNRNIVIGVGADTSGATVDDELNIGNLITGDLAGGICVINDVLQLTPTTTPGAPVTGMVYANSAVDNQLLYYDGTAWHHLYRPNLGVAAALTASDTTTITVAATYYPIEGTFTNVPMEGFSFQTEAYGPVIQYDGTETLYFEIDAHASVAGDSNGITVTAGLKKNNVLITTSTVSTYMKTLGELFNMSGTSVVELATGDNIQMVVTSDGSGDVITFNQLTATIRRFF